MDKRRSGSIATVLVAIFVLLVVVTVGGVVHDWPHDHLLPGLSGGHAKTYRADVLATRVTRCPTPVTQGCSVAVVRLTSGPDSGRRTNLSFIGSSHSEHVSAGDAILLAKDGPSYSFVDFDRSGALLWLAAIFALVVVVVGRWHGLRALFGLTASLATVVFFVVPAIADGKPAVQVAAFGGLGVMLLTMPVVHGGGAKSLAACLGTAAALFLTLGLSDLFTSLVHLSGLASDEAFTAQLFTSVSTRGLLLAGMTIGALGVLGDTTVTQASTVIALRRANPSLGFTELVRHATSVGRDHIAATINTLVLAYTGASLPLLIILSTENVSLGSAINGQAIAEPVVATLVGSIGLVAAVPFTTALASLLALHLPERRLAGEHVHAHAH
ncbi:MAG TPA: YibE/F family protein [Gaiellaceae bacterium]|nr:YibE/F family protein [Gaiellaceae bacterium]